MNSICPSVESQRWNGKWVEEEEKKKRSTRANWWVEIIYPTGLNRLELKDIKERWIEKKEVYKKPKELKLRNQLD